MFLKSFIENNPLIPKTIVVLRDGQVEMTRERLFPLAVACGKTSPRDEYSFRVLSELWLLWSVGYPRKTHFIYSFRNLPGLTNFLMCGKHQD
jgi:hypothetical protein